LRNLVDRSVKPERFTPAFGSNAMNPPQTRPAIKITVEAHNRSDTMTLDDSDMDGFAGCPGPPAS
jgi:hypothetical protein